MMSNWNFKTKMKLSKISTILILKKDLFRYKLWKNLDFLVIFKKTLNILNKKIKTKINKIINNKIIINKIYIG